MLTKDSRAYQFVAYCLVVLVGALAVRTEAYRVSLVVEATIYFSLLALLARHRPTRIVLLEAPPIVRCLLSVLMGALLIGQLADAPARTYPFVNWTMYSTPLSSPTYSQFIAVLEDGSRIPLPLGAIPTPVRPLTHKLQQLASRARADDQAGLSARRVLVQTLQSLASQYQAAGNGLRLLEVVLERCEFSPSDYRGRDSITCTPLQRFAL
jgi:hypothetical protein